MTVGSPERLTDPAFHAAGDPHALWQWMREHAPVRWHPPAELPGFWSLTRHEDIRSAYRSPELFSSARGVLLRPIRSGEDPGGGLTLALTDPPRHRRMRSLMAAWFGARAARLLQDSLSTAARSVLARAVEMGECDFVHDVVARMMLAVVCDLMGIPECDHEAILVWTDEAFDAGTPLATHQKFMGYFIDLMDRRTVDPANDLVSVLVHGTVDGDLLTETEILLNCENLVGATENARLSMAGAMLAFLEHPDQWRCLQQDRALLPTAIEEVLRWTSSATHSMRTLTAPAVICGQRVETGDRVVLWIPSANRDDAVFPSPERFDIARRPNAHLALGAGEHMCIGSVLARTAMNVLLMGLLDTVDRVEQSGSVDQLQSISVNGPAHLPVRMTARTAIPTV